MCVFILAIVGIGFYVASLSSITCRVTDVEVSGSAIEKVEPMSRYL